MEEEIEPNIEKVKGEVLSKRGDESTKEDDQSPMISEENPNAKLSEVGPTEVVSPVEDATASKVVPVESPAVLTEGKAILNESMTVEGSGVMSHIEDKKDIRGSSVKNSLNEELFMDICEDSKDESLKKEQLLEDKEESVLASFKSNEKDSVKEAVTLEQSDSKEDTKSPESQKGKFISSFATASSQSSSSSEASIPILKTPVALTIDSKLGKGFIKSFAIKHSQKGKDSSMTSGASKVEAEHSLVAGETGAVEKLKIQGELKSQLDIQTEVTKEEKDRQSDDTTEVAMDISDDSSDAVKSEEGIQSPDKETNNVELPFVSESTDEKQTNDVGKSLLLKTLPKMMEVFPSAMKRV